MKITDVLHKRYQTLHVLKELRVSVKLLLQTPNLWEVNHHQIFSIAFFII